jgi:small subunit ribosomal protein S15
VWGVGFLKSTGDHKVRQQPYTLNPTPETVKVWVFYNGRNGYLCRQLFEEKFWMLLKKIEMPYLTKEKTGEIFAQFGGKATNTGSIEGQVALLTERINRISEHLQQNKKDFSTHRGLMRLVGQRKRLLNYLSKQNLQGYRALIEKLGIRK